VADIVSTSVPDGVACAEPAYGRLVTITYDDALREQIGAHLAGHEHRAVTDPAKRHAPDCR
jgi:hypothetical protein